MARACRHCSVCGTRHKLACHDCSVQELQENIAELRSVRQEAARLQHGLASSLLETSQRSLGGPSRAQLARVLRVIENERIVSERSHERRAKLAKVSLEVRRRKGEFERISEEFRQFRESSLNLQETIMQELHWYQTEAQNAIRHASFEKVASLFQAFRIDDSSETGVNTIMGLPLPNDCKLWEFIPLKELNSALYLVGRFVHLLSSALDVRLPFPIVLAVHREYGGYTALYDTSAPSTLWCLKHPEPDGSLQFQTDGPNFAPSLCSVHVAHTAFANATQSLQVDVQHLAASLGVDLAQVHGILGTCCAIRRRVSTLLMDGFQQGDDEPLPPVEEGPKIRDVPEKDDLLSEWERIEEIDIYDDDEEEEEENENEARSQWVPKK